MIGIFQRAIYNHTNFVLYLSSILQMGWKMLDDEDVNSMKMKLMETMQKYLWDNLHGR